MARSPRRCGPGDGPRSGQGRRSGALGNFRPAGTCGPRTWAVAAAGPGRGCGRTERPQPPGPGARGGQAWARPDL